MRARIPLACAVVAVVALAACGSDDSGNPTSAGTANQATTTTAASDTGTATDYLGLSKAAAIAKADAAGVPWRILREDGEHFLVTQDYNPRRVNFEIDDGEVTKATSG